MRIKVDGKTLDTRYDDRVVYFRFHVNSDMEETELVSLLQAAARGPRSHMVVVALVEVGPGGGKGRYNTVSIWLNSPEDQEVVVQRLTDKFPVCSFVCEHGAGERARGVWRMVMDTIREVRERGGRYSTAGSN